MESKNEIAPLFSEVKRKFKQLKGVLPSEIKREDISMISKTALKAYQVKAGLLHRISDIVDAVIQLCDSSMNLPAFILTRATVETYALYYYFLKKIEKSVLSKNIKDIDDVLMKLLFGARNTEDEFKAINILTAIDALDKECPNFRSMYDDFCEIAHPNWLGTCGRFSGSVQKDYTLYFESSADNLPVSAFLKIIDAMLGDILEVDQQMEELLKRFTELHEREYENHDSHKNN